MPGLDALRPQGTPIDKVYVVCTDNGLRPGESTALIDERFYVDLRTLARITLYPVADGPAYTAVLGDANVQYQRTSRGALFTVPTAPGQYTMQYNMQDGRVFKCDGLITVSPQ